MQIRGTRHKQALVADSEDLNFLERQAMTILYEDATLKTYRKSL